ncbi:MAG: thiolase family protein [Thermoproteus sp. AZ2]|jgi:acetyl-CoA C-acetyltransferase/acetyl-CoA acyltransferase|uniref:Thiolase family protein n=1 Tax=Thermoproteus sp. AZ2 TaxID=1609232 RepID=A0ACC6V232_9CREN|nr:MAG: acetyl-CoA acyltransferase [Thermoproteus sp. AZ2]
MIDVWINGAAMMQTGRHYSLNIDEMGAKVLEEALKDAGYPDLDAIFVASATAEQADKQQMLGAYIAARLGLDKVATFRVENADGSGGSALVLAASAVRSGLYNCVAVVGVDKPNDVLSNQQQDIYSTATDSVYERFFGVTPAAQAAIMAKLYLKKYEYKYEDLALWPVLMHKNGASNPYAYMRKQAKVEDVLDSELVSDPLRLYDVGPMADGAAAAVLCNRKGAVRILGMGSATSSTPFNARQDYDVLYSAKEAAERAYKMAGITARDVAAAEVHDSYSIFGVLAAEALGLAQRGQLLALLKSGADLNVNLSGGLKSRGNVMGATGVYQAVEVAWQLLGKSPFKKADGNIGVIHSMGGADKISTVVVLGL